VPFSNFSSVKPRLATNGMWTPNGMLIQYLSRQ
jgi:hypothetical protein